MSFSWTYYFCDNRLGVYLKMLERSCRGEVKKQDATLVFVVTHADTDTSMEMIEYIICQFC